MNQHMHRVLVAGITLGLYAGLAADVTAQRRDDTEIFFGPQTLLQGGSTPNILFSLDTSGSMAARVQGTTQTRFAAMIDATTRLINSVNNVNMGLMRFTDPGGPILYPVVNVNEPAINLTAQTARNTSSDPADDAEEVTSPIVATTITNSSYFSGNANLQGRTLALGNASRQVSIISDSDDEFFLGSGAPFTGTQVQWNIRSGQINGVRFSGLDGAGVVAGSPLTAAELARIASVTLDFTARINESGGTGAIQFLGGADPAAPAFDGVTPFNGVTRPLTAASALWTSVPAFSQPLKYFSPELLPVFSEIAALPGWTVTSPVSFFAQVANQSDTVSRAPHRHTPASADRRTRMTLSVATPQNVGLRFPSLEVPKGATIRSARVIFTAGPHPHTDGRRQSDDAGSFFVNPVDMSTPVTVSIHGELSGNPCRFASTGTPPPGTADGCTPASTSPGRVNTRTLTTASLPAWEIPAFTPDELYSTPDISGIVQELVNQDGFCGGNAVSLQLRHVAGNGQRLVYGADDGGRGAVIEVEFDPTQLAAVDNAGCIEKTYLAAPAAGNDDAWSEASRTNTGGTLRLAGNAVRWTGIRFRALALPQGASVGDVSLTLQATGSNFGTANLRIWAENRNSAGAFNSGSSNISGRPRTSAFIDVTLPANSSSYTITGLGPLVQQVLNRGGWRSGNNLVLIFQNRNRDNNEAIEVHSFNSSPTDAPVLRVSIDFGELTGTSPDQITSNRDELLAALSGMSANGWTPLVGTQLEAARYFRGMPVLHGRGLGHDSPTGKSLSHPQSYTGGSQLPANCGTGPASARCTSLAGEPVYRSPIANECSPNHFVLLSDGEANHNAFENGVDHGLVPARDFAGGTCRTTINNPDGTGLGVTLNRNLPNANEFCGREIAHVLANPGTGDGTLNNTAKVVTHTVAFNLAAGIGQTFLRDVAINGQGTFNTANTADELLEVFNRIVASIADNPASFAAPATAVNTFNRLRNLDDIYFSLFKPSLKSAWVGNIKRYKVAGEEIVGADGLPAVSAVTGEFLDSARSFWDVDGQADGRQLDAGGAAEAQLAQSPADRKVYTYLGSYADVANSDSGVPARLLPADFDSLSDEEKARYASLLGITPGDTTLPVLHRWVRGEDVDDTDGDGATTDARYTYGDPLHASPVVVTLGGTAEAPVQMVVTAGNDGALRWLDASTGRELGVYLPPEQLGIQAARRANLEGEHIYGLDATPSVWVLDTPPIGIIEPSKGDFVRVIFGERDGGDRYYAIDLTPDADLSPETTPAQLAGINIAPKLLWKIDGSPAPGDLGDEQSAEDFADLGLTWSEPLVRRVRFGNEENSRTVVIFGGGNDERFDRAYVNLSSPTAVTDFQPKGNILYIVDATSGRLLTSIGGPNTSAKLKVPGMHYPIPSTISAVSSTGLREVDRFYFGDVGGNLWRVDLNPGITAGATGASVATVGLLASVSKPQTAGESAAFTENSDTGAHGLNTRKFYNPPAIVRQLDSVFSAESRHTLVLLGTGSRANPINFVTQDHFYAFRDLYEERLQNLDSDNNGFAEGYPVRQQLDPLNPDTTTGPIGGSSGGEFGTDLVDVTDNPYQSIVSGLAPLPGSPQEAALNALRSSLGWFMRMPLLETVDGLSHEGEKVLNPATVGLGTLFFTAYTPGSFDDVAATCSAEVGITRVYALNLSTGAANINDFGDPPPTAGSDPDSAGSVLDNNDRSSFKPLQGNPGGTTLLNTDTLKSITGTNVKNIGDVAPVPTYWFQRQ
jgi:type IV pilus assembly protein PilY1